LLGLSPNLDGGKRHWENGILHSSRALWISSDAVWVDQFTINLPIPYEQDFQGVSQEVWACIFYDTLIYNKSLGKHLKPLRVVLQLLRENHLFVKRENCQFGQEHVNY
jgi:hypothetical protein